MKYNIFPTITTCPNFSWKHKLQEVKCLGLTEVSVFPTFIGLAERKRLYKELDKSNIKWVPHVHVRSDFEVWEFEFFWKRFKTRSFNTHEDFIFQLKKWYKYRYNLYVEFDYEGAVTQKADLKLVAGLCVDLSHLWSAKARGRKEFNVQNEYATKHGVGCNHLNGFARHLTRDMHYVRDKHNFDYLKEISKKFFGKIISLELNNSIEKQLEYKKYIEKILK
ncbi:MAG: hypothetical protein UT32_C0002G0062 [Parcubacteria group bacterium GW2011_GWC2_39_14]|nr:MAG: hypothetical protein UT32_C0002G0062 [Parcubacteria group bacterium GW2011_GWC2_39_14]KKR55287.1 MAG: hypothetical protein UT91_C0003G0062 [Parcubacteria group bacterium GW2011_GWA2_40_23]